MMLRSFSEEQRREIVGEGPGSGVSEIWIQPIGADAYDVKRKRAAVDLHTPFPESRASSRLGLRRQTAQRGLRTLSPVAKGRQS